MSSSSKFTARLPLTAAASAAVVIAASASGIGAAAAAPAKSRVLNKAPHSIKAPRHDSEPGTHTPAAGTGRSAGIPAGRSAGMPAGRSAGMPAKGRYAFLLKLNTTPTSTTFHATVSRGTTQAKAAARSQLRTVTTAQNRAVSELPKGSSVLYRAHSVLAGVAVVTDVSNVEALRHISGVAAVYPISPKSFNNSYAVPLQGAPSVWAGRGDLGQNTTIAVIDTGIDYTHANFGGPGTTDAYNVAHAAEGSAPDPSLFPSDKVIGGYDLVGDKYNADNTAATYDPVPVPDPNPLDCGGHGSHVAGTAAGLGENHDGSTYTGRYGRRTPFKRMKIGPGMAPAAKLLAYKVFGCEGSTDLVGAAIDMAADPNGDGDPSDHADVINMSLGADFGSPEDGDAVSSNAAVDLGITVAVASGNAGDYYDVGGSPGDASKVISVANTQDASNVIDGLNITIGDRPHTYGATRAVLYDWTTKRDLRGSVVLAPADNKTACTAYPANTFKDKVALVEWNDTAVSAGTECGSITRGKNLVAAGAAGFIFANTHETFAAGINGSPSIPGVLVVKSGGDAIRAALTAGTPVTVNSTSPNAVNQVVPEDNNKINDSSSRGIRRAGNVKPDVAAVGTSVFSTANGTGNDGVSFTGTSMATPMVAGLAALVKSTHPDWTPQEVKADIMNTAGQDVYENGSVVADKGHTYAPNRVGAGRIKADAALNNDVVAYVTNDPGAVSASFGPVQVTGPMTLKKTIKVVNKGLAPVTYNLNYDAITSVPGVTYQVSPSTLSLTARSSKTVMLSFVVTDASKLTKTVDPTIGRTSSAGFPKETIADASGRLQLAPASGNRPTLRVPVYSAPRPTSVMTQPRSITLPNGPIQSATLLLRGQGVDNGTGDSDPHNDIFSIAAGFELQAVSGLSPQCSATVTVACYRLPEERDADLKYVGITSDYPTYLDAAQSQAYFSVTTQAAFSTPADKEIFQIDIDVNGDNIPDLYLYNTRLGKDDVFVSELVDAKTFAVLDDELINNRFGDVDTALYDSDTMILPMLLDKLAGYGIDASKPRISYGVETYSNESSQPIDLAGVDAKTGKLSKPLSADLFTPAIQVTDPSGDGPLVDDVNGAKLTLTRNRASYARDHGLGALMVHLHNRTGNKAQPVALKSNARVSLKLVPNPVRRGAAVTATVAVANEAGIGASGAVRIRDLDTGTVVVTATENSAAASARASFTVAKAGRHHYRAEFVGDANYAAANSGVVALTVSKTAPSVRFTLSPNPVGRARTVTARITVATAARIAPTGRVSVVQLGVRRPVVASGRLSHGAVTLRFTSPAQAGAPKYRVTYTGDANYSAGSSSSVTVKVARSAPKVTMTASKAQYHNHFYATATIRVATQAHIAATGPVAVYGTDGHRAGRAPCEAARPPWCSR